MIVHNMPGFVVPEESVCFVTSASPLEMKMKIELFKETFEQKVLEYAKKGKRNFIVDLRTDAQVYIAEAVLCAKKKNANIKLVAAIEYYYGYWTGPRWSQDLVLRAKEVYHLADYQYCANKERFSIATHVQINFFPFLNTILENSSLILGYISAHSISSKLLQTANKRNIRIENLYDDIQKKFKLSLKKYPFEKWPLQKPEGEIFKKYLDILNGRKSMCFQLSRRKNSADSLCRGIALQAVLTRFIEDAVCRGFDSFIITLDNPYQVLAAHTVLGLKKKYPHICCASFVLSPILYCDESWWPEWDEEARAVYYGSDIHDYFTNVTVDSSLKRLQLYFQLFLCQFCSEVVFCKSEYLKDIAGITMAEFERNMGIKHVDLDWGITKEITKNNINNSVESFCEFISDSDLTDKEKNELHKWILNMPEEEKIKTMWKFRKTNQARLSTTLNMQLKILSEYHDTGKITIPT